MSCIRVIKSFFFVVFICFAPPVLSQNSPNNLSELPQLQAAAILIRLGELDQARDILARSTFDDLTKETERVFLLGLLEKRSGNDDRAVSYLQKALDLTPEQTRIRLELADAYYRSGQVDKARFHFRAAAGDNRISPRTQDTINTYLDNIKANRRWSASFGFAFVPETNPRRRASVDTVDIGGATFTINEDTNTTEAVGVQVRGGVTYTPHLSETYRARLALTGVAKLSEEQDFNDISVGGEAGVLRLHEGGLTSIGLQASRRFIGNDGFSTSVGPIVRARHRITPKSRLSGRAGVNRVEYDTLDTRNGLSYLGRLDLDYYFTPEFKTNANIEVSRIDAEAENEKSTTIGAGVGATASIGSGFIISGVLFGSRSTRDGINPIFQEKRDAYYYSVTSQVLNRRIRYAGISPYIQISYEKNSSDIEFYSFENYGALIGFTKAF